MTNVGLVRGRQAGEDGAAAIMTSGMRAQPSRAAETTVQRDERRRQTGDSLPAGS